MYVFDLPRFWPLLDNLDLLVSHCQAKVRQDISEELNRISVLFAFIRFGIETVFSKVSEQFANVFLVLSEIIRIDEDIIETEEARSDGEAWERRQAHHTGMPAMPRQ